MTPEEARGRLAEWVREQPERWPLAEGALLLAVDDYPQLEPAGYLGYLEELGERVRRLLDSPRPPATAAIAALTTVVFDEQGFRGNTEEYYDPRNSYLNEVIDRRMGLPITLSVIAIEVARRSGLPVSGVGFPRHFLMRYEDEPRPRILDPFHHCRELSREELLHQW